MAIDDKLRQRKQEARELFWGTTQYGEAHDALLACLAEAPNDVDILYTAAESYWHGESMPEKAVCLLERAIRLDPARAECKCLLADIKADDDMTPLEELLPLIGGAIELEPDWVVPRVVLATLREQMGDREGADQAFAEALEIQRGHRQSGEYDKYSYFEAVTTGRHTGEMPVEAAIELNRTVRRMKQRTKEAE